MATSPPPPRRLLAFVLLLASLLLCRVQSLSLLPNQSTKKQRLTATSTTTMRRLFRPMVIGETVSLLLRQQREPQELNKLVPSLLRTAASGPRDTRTFLTLQPTRTLHLTSRIATKQKTTQSSWKRRLGFVACTLVALCLAVASPALASTPPALTSTAAAASSSGTAALNLAPMLSRSQELRLMGRLWYAALFGAMIGKERSTANRHPAGVRTLALVALGSSAFTVVSMYGFGTSNVGSRFDASRMASAVASGISFIGAGVITTTTRRKESVVHGLTTAAAVWIAASVGVTCGCGLYILATSLGLASLGFLRIGGAVKHKRSYYRHPERALQDMVQTDPELLRKLIDWEKVDLNNFMMEQQPTKSTTTEAKTSTTGPKKYVKIEPILVEDKDDECLISNRYFPQEEKQSKETPSSSSYQEEEDQQDDHGDDSFTVNDGGDELFLSSSSRDHYKNETEAFHGKEDSARLQRRSSSRRRYDDDAAP